MPVEMVSPRPRIGSGPTYFGAASVFMPHSGTKTDDQGKTSFGRGNAENVEISHLACPRFFAYMGCERLL